MAGGRCEYCHLPDGLSRFRHHLDHIVAHQHGGATLRENLALCCPRCNQFKGPNLTGIDPESGAVARLFHPRQDNWEDHFRWDGAVLIAKTATGRATIATLSINIPIRVAARRALLDEGRFGET